MLLVKCPAAAAAGGVRLHVSRTSHVSCLFQCSLATVVLFCITVIKPAEIREVTIRGGIAQDQ